MNPCNVRRAGAHTPPPPTVTFERWAGAFVRPPPAPQPITKLMPKALCSLAQQAGTYTCASLQLCYTFLRTFRLMSDVRMWCLCQGSPSILIRWPAEVVPPGRPSIHPPNQCIRLKSYQKCRLAHPWHETAPPHLAHLLTLPGRPTVQVACAPVYIKKATNTSTTLVSPSIAFSSHVSSLCLMGGGARATHKPQGVTPRVDITDFIEVQ